MKSLFIVAAKLLGLWQLYAVIMQVGQFLPWLFISGMDTLGSLESKGVIVTGIVCYLTVPAWFAWLLLARSHQLANRLGVTDDIGLPVLDTGKLLWVGVKLLGLMMAISASATLVQTCASVLLPHSSDSNSWVEMARRVPSGTFRLLLGFLLAFKTDKVVGVICGREDSPNIAMEPTPARGTDAAGESKGIKSETE